MTDLPADLSRLRQYFEQYVQTFDLPGLAVAVTDREKVLGEFSLGYADLAAQTPVAPGALFEIGSISKSFTAIALLQLQEEGRLDVNAPVTRYLPWFEVKSRYEPIALHHLLTHTAGLITGQDGTPTALSEVWALRQTEAGAPPGAFFHYSNSGYKVLGLVLEEVCQQPYGEIIQQRLLDPLGMTATEPIITHDTRRRLAVGYAPLYDDRPFPRGAPVAPAAWLETDTGDGSIASTAADMAAYLRMLLNRGQGPQGRLLSEASFGLLTQRAIRADDGPHEEYYGYGLDIWEDEGHACLGHGGSMVGYMAAMYGDLDAGLGVVALSNGQRSVTEAARAALRILRAPGREAPPPKPPAQVENSAEYAGTYRGDGKALTVEADGAQLFVRHNGERVPLEAASGKDQFHVLHPDFALFLLRFGCEAGQVVEAFHGPDWYAGAGYGGPARFDAPAEWQAYPGHYRAHNPWYSNFRIVLRKGGLALIYPDGEERALIPMADSEERALALLEGGAFRVGADERLPEQVRFGLRLNGRAERADLAGAEYYRTFTP